MDQKKSELHNICRSEKYEVLVWSMFFKSDIRDFFFTASDWIDIDILFICMIFATISRFSKWVQNERCVPRILSILWSPFTTISWRRPSWGVRGQRPRDTKVSSNENGCTRSNPSSKETLTTQDTKISAKKLAIKKKTDFTKTKLG